MINVCLEEVESRTRTEVGPALDSTSEAWYHSPEYRLMVLRRGAPLLYGSRWKRSLAVLIGVSERTLHRWLSGESDTVPNSAVRKLDSAIELYHTRLGEYLHERRKER